MQFKVGDKVRRPGGHADRPVYTVVEVFPEGWFNHSGGTDHSPLGDCYSGWWELVEAGSARSTDPVTSKGKRRVNKYEQAVLDVLDCEPHGPQNVGLTGKEMAVCTGHPLNCITPRFAPLRRRGLIQPKMVDGNIVKRDKQIVWVRV